MTTPRNPDQLLSLIAEGILEASDDEIIAAAQAHGLDVVALERRVREIIATHIEAAQSSPAPNFQIGHTVSLRSDPARIGVITGITPSNRETRLNVFIDGRLETWYLSQVIAADLTPGAVRATLDEFSARLTALQLAEPSIANLYSLQAGRIDFIPYQFRPVLKFVRADRPRMLVADEVGVGKTIEAGLLLRELQARRPLRSVLIVCSKALVVEEKWHREMRRFDEEFVTLGSDDLRYCLDQSDLEGEWPDRFSRAILPFSLVNENLLQGFAQRGGGRGPGLRTLDTPPGFDLLIVDEAHNARTVVPACIKAADSRIMLRRWCSLPRPGRAGDRDSSRCSGCCTSSGDDRPTFERWRNQTKQSMRRSPPFAAPPGWQTNAPSHLKRQRKRIGGALCSRRRPNFATCWPR